jgi:hypothetical protein
MSNVKNAASSLVTVRATRSSIFLISRDRLLTPDTEGPRRGAPSEEKTKEDEGRVRSRGFYKEIPTSQWTPSTPRGSPSTWVLGLRRSVSPFPLLAGPKKTGRHGPDHEIAR